MILDRRPIGKHVWALFDARPTGTLMWCRICGVVRESRRGVRGYRYWALWIG